MKNNKKLGLSLSGGGYRAAAFHLGTLRKLEQMGIIENIDVISTISGGSIAGAYYLLHKNDFASFETGMQTCLQKSVIKRIVFSWPVFFLLLGITVFIVLLNYVFSHQNPFLLSFISLICILFFVFLFQFFFLPFTALKIKAYRKIFFGDKKLSDFPDQPEIAINATNLETGTLWTYSKKKVSDSSYQYPKDGGATIVFNAKDFPIAVAVASSTAVPVPFNPVKIDKKYFANEMDFERIKPALSDGGLYDNQGLHKITEKNSSYFCDIIICSDGSQPFNFQFKGVNSFDVLYRATDIMMRKIKSLQFIRDVYAGNNQIAYFSLDWKYETCLQAFVKNMMEGKIHPETLQYHQFDITVTNDEKSKSEFLIYLKEKISFSDIVKTGLTNDEIKLAQFIKTNLTSLTIKQIDLLSRHAEVLTEIQLKLYCPGLLNLNRIS